MVPLKLLRASTGTGLLALASLTLIATPFSNAKANAMQSAVISTNSTSSILIPSGYVEVLRRTVAMDGEGVELIRHERLDGRNKGFGGEHVSMVLGAKGMLKGYARMEARLAASPLPSEAEARETAMAFLKTFAEDALPHVEISWIAPHDEIIRVTGDQGPQEVVLTGMKVKMYNRLDARWLWVIVGANRDVLVFERDIEWINFPGYRKTEKWLHDTWLAKARL